VGLDAGLAAVVTLQRQHGGAIACSADDALFQLSLAHVLLDGGYDGLVTIGEVMAAGDHGLGTVDRLDGELVVVDGVAWRVDVTGVASVVPSEMTTPFVVLSRLESPVRVRVSDLDREQLLERIDAIVGDAGGVASVRLEGRFRRALLRSVPAQTRPYRPYAEVCATDEVRFDHQGFEGVFVGFRFPNLDGGATIGGLHLHGLDSARTTGGHNHELLIDDALLSVSTSRDISIALADRSMVELLEMPGELRAVQRVLLRRGPLSETQLSAALGLDLIETTRRLRWLSDRGFVDELPGGVAGLGGAPRWKMTLRTRGQRIPARAGELLAGL
jgi:acetolactate decarboxylase